MRRIISRLIIAVGLGLVGLGKRIEPPPIKPTTEIRLSRRHYRVVSFPPSRLEVFRLGFSVLFSSARFGLIGV